MASLTLYRLSPGEITPDNHWTGGWMGHRAGLGVVAWRKYPSSFLESNPGHAAHSVITMPS